MEGADAEIWTRGFRVQGSGFRVQGSGFRIQGSWFMVQGPGFMVQGSGFWVWVWGWGLALRTPVPGTIGPPLKALRGPFQPSSWSRYLVLGAILWTSIAKRRHNLQKHEFD